MQLPIEATLLELLRFYANVYVGLARNLYDLELCLHMDECSHDEKSGPYRLKSSQRERAQNELALAEKFTQEIGLEVSVLHVRELLSTLDEGEIVATDIKALHKNIERELSCRFYIGIPQDRKDLYCESLKTWEDVVAQFPEATDDIEEMNKCFALSRYPAAVFHSLLVVEHGLVRLGQELKVTDPKEGWDASCRKLSQIVSAGHNANNSGFDFGFLEQLNSCVQVMKLAWRNKVNHATGRPVVMYGAVAPNVALEIITATRGFMRRLAEGMPQKSGQTIPTGQES